MSLPKHPFDTTLLSCLSCPNLATTFSRQNWQGAAVKEKFGSRCCLQYTVLYSLFLPSSHFLLFWSKVVLLYYTTTTTILLWSRLMVTQIVRCVQYYHVIRLNIGTIYLGNYQSPFHIICNITYVEYGNTGCGVFKRGDTDLWQAIGYAKTSLHINHHNLFHTLWLSIAFTNPHYF